MATRGSRERDRRAGTALFSVHSDDIVLAIHYLKRFFPRPWTLITVFSNSSFAKQQSNSQSIRAAREFEDFIYGQREGMAYLGLGFEDRPGLVAADRNTRARVMSAIRAAFFLLLDELQPQFVLAPFAVRKGPNSHVHHSIVSDAAIEVMRSRSSTTLALFDEFCYARLPLDEIPRVNGAAYIPHVVPLCEQALGEKLESMRIYETQKLSRFDGRVRVAEGEIIRLPCNGFHSETRSSVSPGANPGSPQASAAAVVRTRGCIEGLMGRGRPHGPSWERNRDPGDRHRGFTRRRGQVVEAHGESPKQPTPRGAPAPQSKS